MDVSTESAEDARRAREAEYGVYVATEAIHIDGVLAFNTGDPVPVGHVKRFGLEPAVAKRGSEAKAEK